MSAMSTSLLVFLGLRSVFARLVYSSRTPIPVFLTYDMVDVSSVWIQPGRYA